ncbi:transcription factor SPT20 homolog [Schistocerca serialis cubense]|uniref:transcription factor SPT20 homolog n=1 Tax=Schistocerca serialis cubense TaxID=2023355 RepID=UPI00214EB537|nr:transcription factor SPT20 homolog [Schistocerca serialis cubense]
MTEPASLSVVSMHTGDQPLFTSLVVHTPGAEGSATVGSPDELQHVSQTQHWPYPASLSPTQVVGSTPPPISSLLLTRGNALFFLNDVDGSSSPNDQLQAPAEVGSASAGRDVFDHAKALGNSDTFHQSDAMPATTPVATTPPPAPSLTSPPASPLQSMPYRQQLQKPHSWPPQPVASQQHREQQQLQLQSSKSQPRQPQASQSTEQQLQLQQLKNPHSPPRESPQTQSTGQQLQGQKLRVKQKHRSNRHRHNKQRPASTEHSSMSSGTDFANGSGGARVPPPPTLPQLGGRWDVSTQQLSTQQLAPQQLPPQLGAPAGSFVAQLPLTPGGGPDAASVPALVIPITALQAAASPSLLLQQLQQQQQGYEENPGLLVSL